MSNFDVTYPFAPSVPEELIIVCTLSGRVIYQSNSLQALLEEELTGRNLNDFVADKLVALVISNAQQERPFEFETPLQNGLFLCKSERTGENIHIALTPLNEVSGVFINKNTAEFISREINLALSLMFSAVDTAESAGTLDRERTSLAILRQNMYRLMRLSRNMLDCALANSGDMALKRTLEDMSRLCRDLDEKLAHVMKLLNITFTVKTPEHPVICPVDRERVERMIYNLIANSIRAIDKRREIGLTLSEKEGMVQITVTDRGRGVDPGLLPQVLQKHSRMNAAGPSGWSGAGFGLALVDILARRHGGSFFITSIKDQVTLARITLPPQTGNETLSMGSLQPDYTGGHDRVLVELSTALGKEFYSP